MNEPGLPARRNYRVLVVDDSAIVRKLLGDALRSEPDVDVAGAADPYLARDMILQQPPDCLTLDMEMPRMDGLTFLRHLMAHHPLPVIVISSLTQAGSALSIEALRAGAIDVIPKPGGLYSVGDVADRLKRRVRALRAGAIRLTPMAAQPSGPQPSVSFGRAGRNALIVVGASTGGTQAIEALLTRLPADAPPLLIVQHMPPQFTAAFAEGLNRVCALDVREAQNDEVVRRGVAYIAPGDRHLLVEQAGVQLRIAVRSGPPVHYQRPAVDVLFHAAARLRGVPIVAALLTGMGADGAEGLLALRHAGAETIAQDEHSCVVFGMPREAIALGAAAHVAALWRMPALMAECLARLQEPALRADCSS